MIKSSGRLPLPRGASSPAPGIKPSRDGPTPTRSCSSSELLHASSASDDRASTSGKSSEGARRGGGKMGGRTGGGALGQIQASLGLILLGLVGMATLGILPDVLVEEPVHYAVVMDGGSSGSRIHVFSLHVKTGEMPRLRAEEGVLKIQPGLSSFEGDPSAAGESLRPLVEFAEKYVPKEAVRRTPIMLMATAGLRTVPPAAAEAILDSCRATLEGTPFRFVREWAEILPGSKEGLYAWIAANYAAGTLSKADPSRTLGVIELGGVSMQLTFSPRRVPPKQFREELRVAGARFTVYTHSALGLGQEAAHAAHEAALREAAAGRHGRVTRVPDPCTPRGFAEGRMLGAGSRPAGEVGDGVGVGEDAEGEGGVRGRHGRDIGTLTEPSGNFTACREAAGRLLGLHRPCAHERCGPAGSYLPQLRGTFLATENFYYTAQFLRLPERATIADVARTGADVCASDWVRLSAERRLPDEELLKYCFSASFIVAALHDAMGIGMDEPITFSNSVEGTAVDWALGAAIAFAARSVEEEGAGLGQRWGADASREPNGLWRAAVSAAAAALALSAVAGPAVGLARRGGSRLIGLRLLKVMGIDGKRGSGLLTQLTPARGSRYNVCDVEKGQ